MSNEKEIRDLFNKHGVALNRDDVWMVQSSHVVKHKALERLAAALKVKYSAPQILRAERDEAVILVTGSLGEATEWSIGEALVNANYRVTGKMAPYVYAMAEKRAKDRVIIKLAGLHGVYSEDEADEFREAMNGEALPKPPRPPERPMPTAESSAELREKMIVTVMSANTPSEFDKISARVTANEANLLDEDARAVFDAVDAKKDYFRSAV